MRLTADYHTHTVHSHGTGSVNDNVEAAIGRGLSCVGIADHSVRHLLYGVKRGRLGQYISCIEDAKRTYGDRITVKSGIELNLIGLDGSADMPPGYNFDIAIIGYHKFGLWKDIRTAWRFFTGYSRFGRIDQITDAYIHAIQKNNIDIVAHPGYGIPVDFRQIGRACADYGTLFEINNKHTELKVEDIQVVAQTGARFVISSDAHSPENVGIVPHAIGLAEKAGLTGRQIVNVTED